MNCAYFIDLRRFGLLIAPLVFMAMPGCDNSPTVSDALVQMEIVIPKLTDTLPSVQHGFLVAKYDASKIGLLKWYYSTDKMKTWREMNIQDNLGLPSDEGFHTPYEDPYEYDVRRWWPSLDTLSDTTLYIKLTAYGGLPFIIKGPIVIR